MSIDLKRSPSKQRLGLLLLGVFGLVASATLFFVNQSSNKRELPTIPTTAAVVEPSTEQQRTVPIENITDITVVEENVQVVAPEKKSSKKRSSSRKQIAYRFPAPPVEHKPNLGEGPGSEVEMWAGDKRSVIFVPPGAKFEEPSLKYEEPPSRFE